MYVFKIYFQVKQILEAIYHLYSLRINKYILLHIFYSHSFLIFQSTERSHIL